MSIMIQIRQNEPGQIRNINSQLIAKMSLNQQNLNQIRYLNLASFF